MQALTTNSTRKLNSLPNECHIVAILFLTGCVSCWFSWRLIFRFLNFSIPNRWFVVVAVVWFGFCILLLFCSTSQLVNCLLWVSLLSCVWYEFESVIIYCYYFMFCFLGVFDDWIYSVSVFGSIFPGDFQFESCATLCQIKTNWLYIRYKLHF